MPTPAAPTAARVLSKVRMATLKPRPSRPIRLAAGTRTSSKNSSVVFEARWPNLSSTLPTVMPGASRGTAKTLRPRGPFWGCELAKTT